MTLFFSVFLFLYVLSYREPLRIDHRDANDVDDLSDSWVETVKEEVTLVLSGGYNRNQLVEGMKELKAQKSALLTYDEFKPTSDTIGLNSQGRPDCTDPSEENTCPLMKLRSFVGIGWDSSDYSEVGYDMFWQTDRGVENIERVLDTDKFTHVIFVWNDDLKNWNSIEKVRQYCEQLNSFEDSYSVRMIYTTGKLPHSLPGGGNYTHMERVNLFHNNEFIRRYTKNNGLALLDLADIEGHDSNNDPCYTNANHKDRIGDLLVECDWDSMSSPAACQTFGSHGEACQRKAIALWYILSRMQGWKDMYWWVTVPFTLFGICCCFCLPCCCCCMVIFYCGLICPWFDFLLLGLMQQYCLNFVGLYIFNPIRLHKEKEKGVFDVDEEKLGEFENAASRITHKLRGGFGGAAARIQQRITSQRYEKGDIPDLSSGEETTDGSSYEGEGEGEGSDETDETEEEEITSEAESDEEEGEDGGAVLYQQTEANSTSDEDSDDLPPPPPDLGDFRVSGMAV